MLLSHKTIVIGIPVYNEARFLADTIQSLKQQSFSDFVVLISDNNSSDESAAIAEAAIDGDNRFYYYRHDRNIGALSNFQFIVNASKSPLFMWLGGHDLLAPTFLEKNVDAMMKDPKLSLSYSYIQLVNASGSITGVAGDRGAADIKGLPVWRYIQAIRYAYGHQINHVIRRSAIAGFIFEPIVIWDLVFLSHLAFKGRFNCIAEPLYGFRDLHPHDSEDTTKIMERITGALASPANQEETISFYMASFDRLAKGKRFYRIHRAMLKLLAVHRIAPETRTFWSSMVRTALLAKAKISPLRRPGR